MCRTIEQTDEPCANQLGRSVAQLTYRSDPVTRSIATEATLSGAEYLVPLGQSERGWSTWEVYPSEHG